MTEALIGLGGALVGLLIGSSITFWSTRRSELERSLVASSILVEELVELSARADLAARDDRLQAVWREHSPALITHMAPEDFARLSHAMRLHHGAAHRPIDELISAMSALSRIFWSEHQAFILTPLINFMRGNTLSKRLHALIALRVPSS